MDNPQQQSASATTKPPSVESQTKSGRTKRRSGLNDNDGWGGFGGYMNARKMKLDEQFNHENKACDSNIFAGVAVYVNGYTNPSSDELRRMLQQNGGSYEMYLSKTRVTHIVATNLPNSKFHMARTMPIVKPEWITDSVSAGKRLSHVPYLLLGNQSKLQPGLKTVPQCSTQIPNVSLNTSLKTSILKRKLENVNVFKYDCDLNKQSDDRTSGYKMCDSNLEGTKNNSAEILQSSFTHLVDVNDSRMCKPEVDHFDEKTDRDIFFLDGKVTANPTINFDDDDDDIVYNSEEDDNSQKDKIKSAAASSRLCHGEVSPYKKKSRVYSVRRVRKSDLSPFDALGEDGTNSRDSLSGRSDLELLDCNEGVSHKTRSSSTRHKEDAGKTTCVPGELQSLSKQSVKVADKVSEASSVHINTEPAGFKLNLEISDVEMSNLCVDGDSLQQADSSTFTDKPLAQLVPQDISGTGCKQGAVASDSLKNQQPVSSLGASEVYEPLHQVSSEHQQISKTEKFTQKTEFANMEQSSTRAPPSIPALEVPHPSTKPSPQKTLSKMAKAGDKNFLNEFYSNSRLHHIATWGAELKAYVAEIQRSGQSSFPGREKLRQSHVVNTMKMGLSETLTSARHKSSKTVMHIDMDCFFVSVGLLSRPDLRGKPVAVTHSRGQGAKPNPDSNLGWEKSEWMKKLNKQMKGTKHRTREKTEDKLPSELDVPESEHCEEDFKATAASADRQIFHSMAEIASCSYEARKVGVKNGMFMGRAVELCPNLQTIPYNFAEYNRVSRILYDVVASYTHDIEAVSCDEMLIDCTDVLADTGATAMEFAKILRAEMLDRTGCSASAGIGPNVLLARLATRRAKPNGQFEVTLGEAKDFIKDQPVKDLPGVGYSLSRKLTLLGVQTCGDLQCISLSTLKQEFGPKTGETLHGFSIGLDSREIKGDKQRKSVSAEVNYGIRFTKEPEAITFLQDLSYEVKRRLDAIGVKGRSITLKLMIRRPDAPIETAKFMGHGVCNTFNKSSNLPVPTNDEKIIAREIISLYRAHRVVASDVRGIGIQINKLESATAARGLHSGAQGVGHQSILNFAVAKVTSTTTAALSPVTTTTTAAFVRSTESTATTNSRAAPDFTSGNHQVKKADISMRSFTALRDFNQGSVIHDPVIDFTTGITNSTSSTQELPAEVVSPGIPVCSSNDQLRTSELHHQEVNSADHLNSRHESGGSRFLQTNVSIMNDPPTSCSRTHDLSLIQHEQHSDVQKPSTSCEGEVLRRSRGFDVPGPSTTRECETSPNSSLLSESQIDSDVLQELPAEIAQEILDDLRLRKQQKQSKPQSVLGFQAPSTITDCLHVHDSRKQQVSGKHVEYDSMRDGLPALSQLDLSCFGALPLHLQRELKVAYAKQEVTTQRSADKMAALSEVNRFTHLKSPSKESKGKRSTKVPGKRGRPRGKKTLNFGHSRIKDGRLYDSKKKLESTRPFLHHQDIIVYDTVDQGSDSRERFPDDASNDCDFQSISGALHPPGRAEHSAFENCGSSCEVMFEDKKDDRVVEEVTFCGACSVDDVRKLLKERLLSCSEPDPDDVSMVTEYLLRLVQHKNLEQAFCLLKFLSRTCRSRKSPQWEECLLNITSCVQAVVCTWYGACFKLS